jgi:hypothetical protein
MSASSSGMGDNMLSVTCLGGGSIGDLCHCCPGILAATNMPYPRLLLTEGAGNRPLTF